MERPLVSDPVPAQRALTGEGPLRQLVALSESNASGQLVCDVEGDEVLVVLQAGRIAWASHARRGSGFLQHLRSHAGVDDESLEHAVAECRQSRVPLSETLVAWKLATPDQVRSALRYQIRTALAGLEQAPPSTKTVFLSRPEYARHTERLTLAVREIFAGPPAPRPVEGASAPEPRSAPAAKPPEAVAKRPEAAAKPPEAVGKRPEAAAKPPEAVAKRPEAAAKPPEAVGKRPEAAAKPPEAAPKRPEAAAKPLAAVANRPDAAAKQPETAAKQPVGSRSNGPGGGPPRREGEPSARSRRTRNLRVAAGAAALALAAIVGVVAVFGLRRVGESATARPGVRVAEPGRQPPGVAAADALVFGMTSQFSGANRDLARSMRSGLEAAFGVANERGGINGRKLQLIALDDAFDPARALQNTKDLVENRKVFALVGSRGTRQAAAVIPYAQEKKVVFIGSASGAQVLRRVPPDRYVFNYRPSTAEEAAAAVRYLVEVRRIRPSQIAYFCQDDEFGESGAAGVDEQLRAYRFDPARTLRLKYPRNTADVAAAVARLKKEGSRVRAVVLVAVAQPAIQFIQQVKDLGTDVIFANISNVDANALSEALVSAGPQYATDVVVTQVVPQPSSSSTAALAFQAALRKHSPEEKPSFFSFEGYIVGGILVEALRRAGKDPDGEALVAALESLRDVDLGIGAPISYGPREHQGSHKVWGTMLQPDGTYRAIRLQ